MALMEMTLLEAVKEFELRIPMSYEQFLAELAEAVGPLSRMGWRGSAPA